jgi:hypothetical protein
MSVDKLKIQVEDYKYLDIIKEKAYNQRGGVNYKISKVRRISPDILEFLVEYDHGLYTLLFLYKKQIDNGLPGIYVYDLPIFKTVD